MKTNFRCFFSSIPPPLVCYFHQKHRCCHSELDHTKLAILHYFSLGKGIRLPMLLYLFVLEKGEKNNLVKNQILILKNNGKIIPASGMFNKAKNARIADLFISSSFSFSCFTEFDFTFEIQMLFNGSTSESIPDFCFKRKN